MSYGNFGPSTKKPSLQILKSRASSIPLALRSTWYGSPLFSRPAPAYVHTFSDISVVHIAKLPIELLLQIWIYYLPFQKDDEHTRIGLPSSASVASNALRLSQVCQHWRRTSLKFPALWIRADVGADFIYTSRRAFAMFMQGGGTSTSFQITLSFSPNHLQLDQLQDNLHRSRKIHIDFTKYTATEDELTALARGLATMFSSELAQTCPWAVLPASLTANALTSFSIRLSDPQSAVTSS